MVNNFFLNKFSLELHSLNLLVLDRFVEEEIGVNLRFTGSRCELVVLVKLDFVG